MIHRSNASPSYVSFNEGSLLSPALGSIRTLHQLPTGKVRWSWWLAMVCSQSLPGCSLYKHHRASNMSMGICLPWALAEVRHWPLLQLMFVGTESCPFLSITMLPAWSSKSTFLCSQCLEDYFMDDSLAAHGFFPNWRASLSVCFSGQRVRCNTYTGSLLLQKYSIFGVSWAPLRHYGCMS